VKAVEDEDVCRLREGEDGEAAGTPTRRGEGTMGVVDAEGGLGRRERCLLRLAEGLLEVNPDPDREEEAMEEAEMCEPATSRPPPEPPFLCGIGLPPVVVAPSSLPPASVLLVPFAPNPASNKMLPLSLP
jgi:hypothetical protein